MVRDVRPGFRAPRTPLRPLKRPSRHDDVSGMRKRKLMAVVAGLVLAAGLVGVIVATRNRLPMPERPAALDQVGVNIDTLALERRELLSVGSQGPVTDLHPDGFGDDGCPLVVGEHGATWPGVRGCSPRSVGFAGKTSNVDAVDWDGDGAPEFLSRGSWCCKPRLYDADGAVLWSHGGGNNAANDTALLPLEGGRHELVIGFNGGGGVERHAGDGSRLWQQEDGNVWQVATVDTDGDGSHEIVHSNACGCLVVRDGEGNVLHEGDPEGYLSNFDVLTWQDEPAILHSEDGRVLLLDASNAGTRGRFEADIAFRLSDPYGAVLRRGDEEWLVTLLGGGFFDRSALTVHTSAGELVYSEVLEGGCEALAGAGDAGFWLACGSEVVAYELPSTVAQVDEEAGEAALP